jgi:hypothetical protein
MNGKTARLIRRYVGVVFGRTGQHLSKRVAYRRWRAINAKERAQSRKDFRRATSASKSRIGG